MKSERTHVDTKKWTGMHQGTKKGKKFQAPSPPNKKAKARLDARIAEYQKFVNANPTSKKAKSMRRPGSMNKANKL